MATKRTKAVPKPADHHATEAEGPMTEKTPVTVKAWSDDPDQGTLFDRPIPDIAATPLAYLFPTPEPAPASYTPGTPEFRYWVAAEALRRGADFWAKLVPLQQWQPGPTLNVLLDAGEDLNAFYDRQALHFFHGAGAPPRQTVYSGESPDILCHEMGHAILDAFKPELWGAASFEAAAFHEAFGDISAALSALQLPEFRAEILKETGGRLYTNSRLSRLAEQLGAAIRAQFPDAVDPDSLRNLVNRFTYRDPATLPSSAPASQLSSEPHSFSRVFSGAFFEMMGALLALGAGAPAETDLDRIATISANLLIQAIKDSPVVTNWYAQVASAMVLRSAAFDPVYPATIKAVFVRRQILSLQSSAALATHPAAIAAAAMTPAVAATLPEIGIPAVHHGVDGLIFVEAAAQPRSVFVMAAAATAAPIEPPSGATAAQLFVDDLFTRGRIDYGDAVPDTHKLAHGRRLRTHRLTRVDGGAKLERILVDCGLVDSRLTGGGT